MYLVKFTDKKFIGYAVSGKSVKIGSILHYRNIEDERFRDEDEGNGSIKLVVDKIDAKSFNDIMYMDGIKLNPEWSIKPNGCPIISTKSQYNPLVFSCSLVQGKSEIKKLQDRFQTNGTYYIKTPRNFMFSIAQSIKKYMIEKYKDMDDSPYQYEDFEKLEIKPVMGQVFYNNKSKDIEVYKDNISDFNPKTFDIKSLFSKPSSFKYEKEFRFMWFLMFGDKSSSFIDETLLVSCLASSLSNKPSKISKSKFVTNDGKPIQLSFN